MISSKKHDEDLSDNTPMAFVKHFFNMESLPRHRYGLTAFVGDILPVAGSYTVFGE